MRKAFAGGAIALAILTPSAAFADFDDGNTLHEICLDEGDVLLKGLCLGYTSAIADAVGNPKQPFFGWTACLNENVTRAQVRDVATAFLRQHPEWRHYSAVTLVAQALAEAFPCR